MVEQEARKMLVYIATLENKALGREYKQGLQEGKPESELKVLRKQIGKRSCAIPAWAEERLASRTTSELEGLSVRVLDTQSLEKLLR